MSDIETADNSKKGYVTLNLPKGQPRRIPTPLASEERCSKDELTASSKPMEKLALYLQRLICDQKRQLQRDRAVLQLLSWSLGYTHPNIVKAYSDYPAKLDVYSDEFLTGETLETVIYDSSITYGWKEIGLWTEHIALGIGHLHKNNIMYINFAPSRCRIIGPERKVLKLLLSEIDEIISGETDQMKFLMYTSPERLESNETSRASGIYAFSMILWEMIYRRKPFEDTNDLRQKILNGERPPIDDSLDPAVADILKRGWSADPKKRPLLAEFLCLAISMKNRMNPQFEANALRPLKLNNDESLPRLEGCCPSEELRIDEKSQENQPPCLPEACEVKERLSNAAEDAGKKEEAYDHLSGDYLHFLHSCKVDAIGTDLGQEFKNLDYKSISKKKEIFDAPRSFTDEPPEDDEYAEDSYPFLTNAKVSAEKGNTKQDEEEIESSRSIGVFEALQYALLYFYSVATIAVVVSAMDDRYSYNGTLIQISKTFLYTTSIFYAFWYPGKNMVKSMKGITMECSPSIASPSLRYLTSLLGIIVIAYNLVSLIQGRTVLETDDLGYNGAFFDRLAELLLPASFTVFVFFNHCYPRKTWLHLLLLALFCSAAAVYLVEICMLELGPCWRKIIQYHNPSHSDTCSPQTYQLFLEILKLKSGNTNPDTATCTTETGRVEFVDGNHEANVAIRSHIVTCKMLVVAVSTFIGFGTICNFGRYQNKSEENVNDVFTRVWITWTFMAVMAFQVSLIANMVGNENSDVSWIKLVLLIVHLAVLMIALSVCILLIKSLSTNVAPEIQVEERNEFEFEKRYSERIDHHLLVFGTHFLVLGCMIVVCTAIMLFVLDLTGPYLTGQPSAGYAAILGLSVNCAKIVQMTFQHAKLIRLDTRKSNYGIGGLIVLWIVNSLVFCLDWFDVATFWIYSYPIFAESNLYTMYTRLCGPLNFFFRFYSLAVIAEKIEDHLRY